ncbi:MAG: hypothetical protein QOE70_350 [Chthoniobacter sp.]|nr:hypothetical protein [Chthoniobacter sp.]
MLTAISGYKDFGLHLVTALEEGGDDFYFALAANNDLYAIKKRHTGGGKTEIHMLTANSGYKDFGLHLVTALEEGGDDFDFALAANNDLYAIKRRHTGGGKTEIHMLTANSAYEKFGLHLVTALEEGGDDFDFALGAGNVLYAFKKRHTHQGKTEILILQVWPMPSPHPAQTPPPSTPQDNPPKNYVSVSDPAHQAMNGVWVTNIHKSRSVRATVSLYKPYAQIAGDQKVIVLAPGQRLKIEGQWWLANVDGASWAD